MTATSIEWADAVWNPTSGCDKVSPGCDNCYALTLAARLKRMGSAKYQNDGDRRTSGPGFGLTTHPDALGMPLRWRKPRRVFVNSMSDLFHPAVSDEFIAEVFAVMAAARKHTFMVLTKRPQRMAANVDEALRARLIHDFGVPRAHSEWPLPNVWLGVSVENQRYADLRIPHLLATPAAVRFLSCEPLLGPVSFRWAKWQEWNRGPGAVTNHLDGLRRVDWVIVGGESGAGRRPFDPEWARSIRDQCQEAGVPFLFKQHGGRTPKAGGRELDGRTWDEFPVPA